MSLNKQINAGFYSRAIRDSVPPGGSFCFIARGGSMWPVIGDGDNIEAKRCAASDLRAGDIIVAETDGHMRVHRLFEKQHTGGDTLLKTRGDALYYEDTPVKEEQLLGMVVSVNKPDGKTIYLETRRARISGLIFLSSGYIKKIMCAIIGPETMQIIRGREESLTRRIRRFAYKCFSILPYRIIAGTRECEIE